MVRETAEVGVAQMRDTRCAEEKPSLEKLWGNITNPIGSTFTNEENRETDGCRWRGMRE